MNKTESRDITKRIIIEFEREDKTLYLDELNKITFLSCFTGKELFKTYLSSTSVEKIIYMIHDILEDKEVNSEFLNIETKHENNYKNPNIIKFYLSKTRMKNSYSMKIMKLNNKGFCVIELSREDLEDFLDNLYNTFVDYF